MRYLSTIPLALCVLLLLPPHAHAQRCKQLNTIIGKVVDSETGDPVAAARIEAIDRDCRTQGPRPVHTDDAGEFRIVVRFDQARLKITYPGYITATSRLISFDASRRLEVIAIALTSEEAAAKAEPIIPISGLEVVATPTRRSPVLTRFDDRVAAGQGWFITRAEVERRKPGRVTDLLAAVPGIELISAGQGNQRVVAFSRNSWMPSDCAVQIYLDGQLVNREPSQRTRMAPQHFTIDEVAVPGDLEGIEIYHGLSSVPPEFLTPAARCGVIALWTRRAR